MYSIDPKILEQKSYTHITDIATKKILVRTCLNVTTDKQGNMIDDTRYQESFPLIKELAHSCKAVLITAHLGRPKHNEPEFSFAKIAQKLEQDLQKDVHFITKVEDIAHIQSGVYMLENVRFFLGEDTKDAHEKEQFAHALTDGFDAFINDAFADYRPSVSTYDVAKKVPSYVGPVFLKEISALTKIATAQQPLVAIVGGAKLSEKLDALLGLLQIADTVLVGGAMAYTLLQTQGVSTGKSLVEADKLDVAREIMQTYAHKIVLPIDHTIVSTFADPGKNVFHTDTAEIATEQIAVDMGPKSITVFQRHIAAAHTIVRNGPLGVCERDATAQGTMLIGKAIAENTKAYKVVGGGDSITAINKLGLTGFNHISTGGGAMLALFAYDKFPTIDVIIQK